MTEFLVDFDGRSCLHWLWSTESGLEGDKSAVSIFELQYESHLMVPSLSVLKVLLSDMWDRIACCAKPGTPKGTLTICANGEG